MPSTSTHSRCAAVLKDWLGIVLVYTAAVTLILWHFNTAPPTPKPEPVRGEQSPDSVPNKVSCAFRGESFCHHKEWI